MDSANLSKNTFCIETELNDILTLNSCTTLLSELIKFILYRKQQLPYTFDRLKYVVTKKNSKAKEETKSHFVFNSIERQFKVAEEGLKTLELIFEKTKEELANSCKWCVSEVALLFGSTPLNPKQVYRIHLPEIFLTHSSVNHPERKHLIHLLQSVIMSNSLCSMLREPLGPTNMYIFIKKSCKTKEISGTENNIHKWFLPKNRYEIPNIGKHFHITLRYPNPCLTTCSCQNFKIYSDDEKDLEGESAEDSGPSVANSVWYQACVIFKGFTDVYVNNVSVADLCLR